MKRILLLFMVITLYNCSDRQLEYVTIEANINSQNTDSIIIKNDYYSKTIYKGHNGDFRDTLKIKDDNYFTLLIDSIEIPIYIQKGMNLKFNTNANALIENLKFEGTHSEENNYLKEKQLAFLNTFRNKKEIYSLEQPEYKNRIGELILNISSSLNKLETNSSAFKSQEGQHLKYDEHSFLQFYAGKHLEQTKSTDFKLLSSFIPKEYSNRVFDDSIAFATYETYKILATNNTYSNVFKKIGRDFNNIKPKNLQESLNNIKIQPLKDAIIDNISRFTMSPENPAMKDLYEIYTSHSTNNKTLEKLRRTYEANKNIIKGFPSPIFESFENYIGGTTSLSDLKGKYVYIDIWATWCGPCREEIPALKQLEKDFHNKNIAFVSISVDNQKSYQNWKKTIEKENLGGIQLISPNVYENSFMREYAVASIPRFILIDPNGKIVNSYAPRPSEEKIRQLLNSLNI